jgi:hypothetical protein
MPIMSYAQKILFFYCRPCGEYHPKTHPHFAEQQARAEERRKAKKTGKQKRKRPSDESSAKPPA